MAMVPHWLEHYITGYFCPLCRTPISGPKYNLGEHLEREHPGRTAGAMLIQHYYEARVVCQTCGQTSPPIRTHAVDASPYWEHDCEPVGSA